MKRYYPGIAVILFLAIILPPLSYKTVVQTVSTKGVCGDFEYELVDDGVKLVKYKGTSESLSIPSEVDGHPVVEIGAGMLEGYQHQYFKGDLVIPEGVKRIGGHAFTMVSFEGKLVLPSTLTEIGMWVFGVGSWIRGDLVLPEGLRSIGTHAFSNNPDIEDVYIPGSVGEIQSEAFDNIKGSIYGIPGSEAERYANENGYRFVDMSVTPPPTWTCGDFVYELVDDGAKLVKYKGTSESLSIPSEVDGHPVVEIGTGMLEGYQDQYFKGDLVIPEGVKRIEGEIGESTFPAVNFEGKLVLPSTLTEIGSYAFAGCIWIEGDLVLPEGLRSIGKDAFRWDHQIEDVYIPGSVEEIQSEAFDNIKGSIYGIPGSEAERYANENGHSFVAFDMSEPTAAPEQTPASTLPPEQTPVSTLFPEQTPASTLPPEQTPASTLPPEQTPVSTLSPEQTPAPAYTPVKTEVPASVPTHKPDSTFAPVPPAGPVLNTGPAAGAPGGTVGAEDGTAKMDKKKMKAPVFSLKRKRTASGKRYVCIQLKRYEGTCVEIWAGRRRKKDKKLVFYKLKMKNNNIRRVNGIFNFQYAKQKGVLVFRIRTYMKKGKIQIYSKKSKGKRIRLL